ncbi:MAG: cob(I)yrinic acid a,c-diamide adenosyltransferase [Thermoanaerobaculia bacterium]|nr:cob(I)yrinic acid a,c-diamide adenosyltransferase [Thermoanaerobaculia bacterium]
MKIYTRTGDSGSTSLLGNERVRKDDPRVAAYGTVDELSAVIGVARSSWPDSPIHAELHRVQADLFEIGSELASVEAADRFESIANGRIEDLERSIDRMEEDLEPLRNFIFPGGSVSAAHLHVARTVCRRAERHVVSIDDSGRHAAAIRYLNRLSDYLFVAARYANHSAGVEDVPWMRSE